MNRHREHTEAAWRKYGRKLWKFGGSYGLGIALMLILLVLTFAGTLHQVRLAPSLGSEAAIESFFGAPYVLIPLGGEHSLISLPLPGHGALHGAPAVRQPAPGRHVPREMDVEACRAS